jgi:uncharacterized protein YbcI
MRSQGEIEAAVCEGLTRFHQEFIGRGPQDIHSHLIGSLLVVRIQGALTAAERQLLRPRPLRERTSEDSIAQSGNGLVAKEVGTGRREGDRDPTGSGGFTDGSLDGGNGRALLKQVRSHVMATGRSRLEEIVTEAAGVRPVSVHHDISTVTGEEVLVFSLEAAPSCRPRRRPL